MYFILFVSKTIKKCSSMFSINCAWFVLIFGVRKSLVIKNIHSNKWKPYLSTTFLFKFPTQKNTSQFMNKISLRIPVKVIKISPIEVMIGNKIKANMMKQLLHGFWGKFCQFCRKWEIKGREGWLNSNKCYLHRWAQFISSKHSIQTHCYFTTFYTW